MALKKLGRMICTVALAGAAIAVPLTMSGCNTDHPEAKITIEYDGTQYVLEYRMYRNMYPQTVQHFIELADNGFYDNTIIHNYQSSYWHGGGYSYIEDETLSYTTKYSEGEEGRLDYMEAASKEKAYYDLANPDAGVITPSVYRDYINGEYSQPLRTLIGEFSNNQHKIENGALKGSYGALRMEYTSKTTGIKDRVYLDKTGSAAGVMGEYKNNSATSLFSIQTGSSTSTDSSRCIFATIKNESELTNLRTAVTRNYSTETVKLYVDYWDEIVESNVNETTYTLTKIPIIIRTVDITKY